MHPFKATRPLLVLFFISSLGHSALYAGSTTYTWAAEGGGGLTLATVLGPGITLAPVPAPSSITVQINYDPTQFVSGTTSGDSTTYQYLAGENGYSLLFSITGTGSPNWPGFVGEYPPFLLTITAPPPGQGPDSIDFKGVQGLLLGGFGDVEILAPNGTLSSSTDVPATLDAFLGYGGSFDFAPAYPFFNNPPFSYLGQATGALVAEPAGIVTLAIGLCLSIPFVMWRRRKAVSGESSFTPDGA